MSWTMADFNHRQRASPHVLVALYVDLMELALQVGPSGHQEHNIHCTDLFTDY